MDTVRSLRVVVRRNEATATVGINSMGNAQSYSGIASTYNEKRFESANGPLR